MVEMLVCQHNMSNRTAGELAHVGIDRGRFDERGTGVDEQRPAAALDQPDRDIAERQATPMHARGQLFPGEVHRLKRNACEGG